MWQASEGEGGKEERRAREDVPPFPQPATQALPRTLTAKVVGAQARYGRVKEARQRFASLLSPSRDLTRAHPQFLVLRARLLATVIETPEEEADAG